MLLIRNLARFSTYVWRSQLKCLFQVMGFGSTTVRLPNNTADRLKSLARSRGLSMNKLVEDMSA